MASAKRSCFAKTLEKQERFADAIPLYERALVERDGVGEAFLLLQGLGEVDERVEEDGLPLQRLAEAGFRALEVARLAVGDAERIQVVEVVAARLVRALRGL